MTLCSSCSNRQALLSIYNRPFYLRSGVTFGRMVKAFPFIHLTYGTSSVVPVQFFLFSYEEYAFVVCIRIEWGRLTACLRPGTLQGEAVLTNHDGNLHNRLAQGIIGTGTFRPQNQISHLPCTKPSGGLSRPTTHPLPLERPGHPLWRKWGPSRLSLCWVPHFLRKEIILLEIKQAENGLVEFSKPPRGCWLRRMVTYFPKEVDLCPAPVTFERSKNT